MYQVYLERVEGGVRVVSYACTCTTNDLDRTVRMVAKQAASDERCVYRRC